MQDHETRVSREIETYRRVENIHDLPHAFHYWSSACLGPHVAQVFGTSNLHEALALSIRDSIIGAHGNPHVLSIGSGDASIELALAEYMRQERFDGFVFHCVELNPHLVERAKAAVAAQGLGRHFQFHVQDISKWKADRIYGAAFAHHSLHHIEALEHLFDQVRDNLGDYAAFVVADMIGRNGHMRWPESLAIINDLWQQIPERYKWHHIWGRKVDPYDNWDCTQGGTDLEGIRAQDILPELLKRFHAHKLCVWGSLTDIFVDRAYGHNLDPNVAADINFIKDLWDRERMLLRSHMLKPTQMAAVFATRPAARAPIVSLGLTPEQCVRQP